MDYFQKIFFLLSFDNVNIDNFIAGNKNLLLLYEKLTKVKFKFR